jgi:hypothetical protein
MGFMWNSCAVGNKYLFATVTYSSAWVSVLAFHQASQASGRWIEVENYGLRYQLFAAGVTVLFTVLAFGVMGFQSDPCFGDYNGGTVVNDKLMVSLIFSTTVWCAGCLGYTRLWLGVRLYSSRFILIYFACWMPQIVWFVLICITGHARCQPPDSVSALALAVGWSKRQHARSATVDHVQRHVLYDTRDTQRVRVFDNAARVHPQAICSHHAHAEQVGISADYRTRYCSEWASLEDRRAPGQPSLCRRSNRWSYFGVGI